MSQRVPIRQLLSKVEGNGETRDNGTERPAPGEAVAIAGARRRGQPPFRLVGSRLPLVYNTGGYDRPETFRWLDGVVDIYMPDFNPASHVPPVSGGD